VRLRSGALIPRQAVVVTPRFAARAEVLRTLGLETTDQEFAGSIVSTYIAADPLGATAVPGVWVAGNVADPFAQVIAAAAAGLKAGAAINADLIEEETARAVAAFQAQHRAAHEPRFGQMEGNQEAPAAHDEPHNEDGCTQDERF